ncbi:hypothetical protein GLOIN_2v1784178 [Rhizophagus irregularis DAOM 181602=DAOM 197198]|nr:hypothetical protein GLOIN_2v1784178 [Rhizophagus irregularis DAOM 181602=DAOM 197198]
MKKKSISETKSTNGLSTDEIRHIIQHETLNPNIPLVSRNVNAIVQEKWYADKQLSDRTIRSIFKNICVECEIDIKGRNICNHSERKTCIFELFDLGIPENTEALSEIVNRLEGLPLLPSSSNTIKRKNSIASQSSLMSDSNSNFDVENELQGNSVLGFCTAKEIMQKDNYLQSNRNSAELDEDYTFKKRKNYKYKRIKIVKKYYKNCTFNK